MAGGAHAAAEKARLAQPQQQLQPQQPQQQQQQPQQQRRQRSARAAARLGGPPVWAFAVLGACGAVLVALLVAAVAPGLLSMPFGARMHGALPAPAVQGMWPEGGMRGDADMKLLDERGTPGSGAGGGDNVTGGAWMASEGSTPTCFGDTAAAAEADQALTIPTAEGSGCFRRGSVDACCNCTFSAVEDINEQSVFPVVSRLVETPFFRYFKVNVYCDCPLWPDDSMCMMQACSVCECGADEVPKVWLDAETAGGAGSVEAAAGSGGGGECDADSGGRCDSVRCAAALDAPVDTSIEENMESRLLNLKGWRGFNNPWMAEGEESEEYLYINLLANPERYTGYQGEHAHRIWAGIYSQPCFADLDNTEARVLHRLLSGMHASISMHLSAKWLIDEDAGEWGPNLKEFERRLGRPELSERVENLYFSFLLVLRATLRAAPLLSQLEYSTGDAAADTHTAALVKELVSLTDGLPAACPMPFDESRMWSSGTAGGTDGGTGGSHPQRARLQAAFRNITTLMDCVGCEKCKLWGKLQTLGIATALKVLHSRCDDGGGGSGGGVAAVGSRAPACDGLQPSNEDTLHLERNEVIALLNLLERLSSSIVYYRQMHSQLVGAGSVACTGCGQAVHQ